MNMSASASAAGPQRLGRIMIDTTIVGKRP
jgi:hypothetical protein